jgi:putative ABC transport system permease protein
LAIDAARLQPRLPQWLQRIAELAGTWWLRNRACLPFALANLLHHRRRRLAAVAGTTVPILLLLFQMAFLDATRIQVTRLFDNLNFDLAVLPESYQFLFQGGTFSRARLMQARGLPGIADSFSLNIGSNSWIAQDSRQRSSLLLIGMDDEKERFIRDPLLRRELPSLSGGQKALVDDFSGADYGPLTTGTTAEIARQPMEIAGRFELGLFFYTEGSAIVRNSDFPRLQRRSLDEVSIGLLQVTPGTDIEAARQSLAGNLPDDVRVLTREELIGQERSFFVSTKPIGILLQVNMLIAFAVGAALLWQVLSTEIATRMHEFAVLKAMGFDRIFVFGIGVAESILMALIAFLPALLAGAVILLAVRFATHIPTALTLALTLKVLAIVLAMAMAAAAAALQRVARLDPAELY